MWALVEGHEMLKALSVISIHPTNYWSSSILLNWSGLIETCAFNIPYSFSGIYWIVGIGPVYPAKNKLFTVVILWLIYIYLSNWQENYNYSSETQNAYRQDHDRVVFRIYRELCKQYSLEYTEKWHKYSPLAVAKNEQVNLSWNTTILTGKRLKSNRPDISNICAQEQLWLDIYRRCGISGTYSKTKNTEIKRPGRENRRKVSSRS